MLLKAELENISGTIERGEFEMEEGIEDIHSQIELMLTRRIGDAGKKIHSGRSRNDQVLLDIRLFLRHKLQSVSEEIAALFNLLISLSEKHRDDLLPGYTHFNPQCHLHSAYGFLHLLNH